jgi:hypothetical protein
MQGESAATYGYENADVAQPEGDLSKAAIDAFSNLATATAVDCGIVATLADANSRLAKELEESAQALKEIRYLLKKEHNDRANRKPFAPSTDNYCWIHGYKISKMHTSVNCMFPTNGHKHDANKNNNTGGPRQTRKYW